jgi:hypothetical protein
VRLNEEAGVASKLALEKASFEIRAAQAEAHMETLMDEATVTENQLQATKVRLRAGGTRRELQLNMARGSYIHTSATAAGGEVGAGEGGTVGGEGGTVGGEGGTVGGEGGTVGGEGGTVGGEGGTVGGEGGGARRTGQMGSGGASFRAERKAARTCVSKSTWLAL